MFDESLNISTHMKQLHRFVCFWYSGCVSVSSRYFGSRFMGHASSEQLAEEIHNSISDLNVSRLLQLSMDGPNVNCKNYGAYWGRPEIEATVMLLNVGSCRLHQVHNAFKAGAQASGWSVDKFLSSLYWLFKDTPARREDFTTLSGKLTFPHKYCNHCWFENVPVVKRQLSC